MGPWSLGIDQPKYDNSGRTISKKGEPVEQEPTPEGDKKQMGREWVDEAEKALERTSDALKAAWDSSRESRLAALQAAKKAASQLGEAIDRGVAGAKDRWGHTEPSEPEATNRATVEEE